MGILQRFFSDAIDLSSRQPYYNYAYAQAGFDVHYLKVCYVCLHHNLN